ncbi:sensor histidine kinase [Pseudoalteromonas rubra]|uniref:sensor histidine kinase n=1 Tax=Pseudoalteromonas rubra TaxID=43658 RepID=UPI000F770F6A|nr:HAMP domain-containing sensor histidine kinase [Pseudoalteromonas rubra]
MLSESQANIWNLLSNDEPDTILDKLAQSLCRKLDADYWRIFSIDFCKKDGPYVKFRSSACKEDDSLKKEIRYFDTQEEQPPPLTTYLVKNKTWIIARRLENDELWECTLGCEPHQPIEQTEYPIKKLPLSKIYCDELKNRDKSRLFWPIKNSEQKLIGFICFYISEENAKDNFTSDDIRNHHGDFAHINITYEHSRSLKRKDVAEKAYKNLIELLRVDHDFTESLENLLNYMGDYVQAYALNLMEYDAQKKRLYTIKTWCCDEKYALPDVYIEQASIDELEKFNHDNLKIEPAGVNLRSCSKMWRSKKKPSSETSYIKYCSLWIAIYDKSYSQHLDDLHRWRGHAAMKKSHEFIQASGTRFYEYFKDYQSFCVQKISADLHNVDLSPSMDVDEVHALTLKQLCKNAGAEVALLYEPVKSGKVILAYDQFGNKIDGLIGLGVAQGSISANLIQKEEACLIPYTGTAAGTDLHKKRLHQIKAVLGWKSIHSWLYHPLFTENRIKPGTAEKRKNAALIGMVKLLTKENKIGLFQQQIVDKILAATAKQWCETQQHHLIDKLPEVMDELMQLSGQNLNIRLLERTSSLVNTYVRKGCHIQLFVNNEDGQLILSGTSKPTHDLSSSDYSKTIKHIKNFIVKNSKEFVFGPKDKIFKRQNGNPIALGMHGLITPIAINGSHLVQGYLIVTSQNRAFTTWETEQINRVVRELSQVIYQEAMRIQWRSDLGVFRHAILAPSQGLVSRAKGFARIIQRHFADDKMIKKQLRLLKRDEFLVQSWQQFQRVLMDQKIKLETTEANLKDCFERWIDRYREWADEKNSKIIFEYNAPELFTFDELSLDIAIGNLLDNAVKYSVSGNNIIVRVSSHSIRKLEIKISNTSHTLSENQIEQAMRFGERDSMHRNISGQGIGLPLAKSLIEAHPDGALILTCDPLPELNGFSRVTATATIIHYWRG